MGPGAGAEGGKVVFEGAPRELLESEQVSDGETPRCATGMNPRRGGSRTWSSSEPTPLPPGAGYQPPRPRCPFAISGNTRAAGGARPPPGGGPEAGGGGGPAGA